MITKASDMFLGSLLYLLWWFRMQYRIYPCRTTQESKWIWDDNEWTWPCSYSEFARR